MKIIIQSEKAMLDLGEKVASRLKGGELLELIGDVGAGKTTFTKGLAKGLGVKEVVQSPSFTIYARYEADKGKELHHYDFYRLADPGIVAYDLEESLKNPAAITVVEWADHVQSVLPPKHITIHIFSRSETERDVHVEGIDL